MLRAHVPVLLGLQHALPLAHRHGRLEPQRPHGALGVLDAAEGEDPLAAAGLLDRAPHVSVLGDGDGELPDVADLDLAVLALAVGVVGVEVGLGRLARLAVGRLGGFGTLENRA